MDAPREHSDYYEAAQETLVIDNRSLRFISLSFFLLVGAADKPVAPPGRSALFRQLTDCRAVKEDSARLACFDRAAASLDDAVSKKDVVVIDKEQVQQARRGLFGLSLPNFHLFGGSDDQNADEIAQIEGKIASASPDADGWRIRLEDGSVWTQTDGKPIFKTPKSGMSVIIRRGALGSYFLRVDNAPGVKVRRVL